MPLVRRARSAFVIGAPGVLTTGVVAASFTTTQKVPPDRASGSGPRVLRTCASMSKPQIERFFADPQAACSGLQPGAPTPQPGSGHRPWLLHGRIGR